MLGKPVRNALAVDKKRLVSAYIHLWELYPKNSRLDLSIFSRLMTLWNKLQFTEIETLFKQSKFTTIWEILY